VGDFPDGRVQVVCNLHSCLQARKSTLDPATLPDATLVGEIVLARTCVLRIRIVLMPQDLPTRYPPVILATCCIPWTANYEFDEECFCRQVRVLGQHLTKHLYIFGTAGEGYGVTESQFRTICRTFRREVLACEARGMVGVISLSLGSMIERIEFAAALGFRDFQISLPSWGALSDREVNTFFEDVCGRFPDLNFLHYNLMRAKRYLSPKEYVTTANSHPNLVATKTGTNDPEELSQLLELTPGVMHFLTETGYAMMRGVAPCGLLISTASTNFEAAHAFFESAVSKKTAEMQQMEKELEILSAILQQGSSEAHIDGAFDKIFCRMHDPAFPLRLLPPYSCLTEATYLSIVDQIVSRLPRWAPKLATARTVAQPIYEAASNIAKRF
jgi:dihydrodipicolinate synthase/N-acetylneuraminate lyase